jgi:epoxyqueuosine reductase
MMIASIESDWIVDQARALGFDLCGIVRASKFPELSQTEEWLARGYAGEMRYLFDARRKDPQSAMPGIRSVIVCGLNYNTPQPKSIDVADEAEPDGLRGWISRYAWGSDYHEVLRRKLNDFVAALCAQIEEPFDAHAYADTGPVQERVLAKYAGLGWLGKNTLLLNQTYGSWIFLGVILTSLDLAPSLGAAEPPPPDLCGTCTRCIDACPTQALVEPYVLDARRCISYLTIELRGSVPLDLREQIGRHAFGCDICQDVCPWNRRAPVTAQEEFQPRMVSVKVNEESQETESLLLPRLEWLASMSEDEYKEVFQGSAVKRTKWRGLLRNTCIALGNSRPPQGTPTHKRISELLRQLSASPDAVVSESALWALSRIQ